MCTRGHSLNDSYRNLLLLTPDEVRRRNVSCGRILQFVGVGAAPEFAAAGHLGRRRAKIDPQPYGNDDA